MNSNRKCVNFKIKDKKPYCAYYKSFLDYEETIYCKCGDSLEDYCREYKN